MLHVCRDIACIIYPAIYNKHITCTSPPLASTSVSVASADTAQSTASEAQRSISMAVVTTMQGGRKRQQGTPEHLFGGTKH